MSNVLIASLNTLSTFIDDALGAACVKCSNAPPVCRFGHLVAQSKQIKHTHTFTNGPFNGRFCEIFGPTDRISSVVNVNFHSINAVSNKNRCERFYSWWNEWHEIKKMKQKALTSRASVAAAAAHSMLMYNGANWIDIYYLSPASLSTRSSGRLHYFIIVIRKPSITFGCLFSLLCYCEAIEHL